MSYRLIFLGLIILVIVGTTIFYQRLFSAPVVRSGIDQRLQAALFLNNVQLEPSSVINGVEFRNRRSYQDIPTVEHAGRKEPFN